MKKLIPQVVRKKILELTKEGMTPHSIWDYLQSFETTKYIKKENIRKIINRAKLSHHKGKNAETELLMKVETAGLASAIEGIEPIMKELIKYKVERENYDYPDDPQEILMLFRNIAEEAVLKYRDEPMLFGICNKVHQSIIDMQIRLDEHKTAVHNENSFNISFNVSVIK